MWSLTVWSKLDKSRQKTSAKQHEVEMLLWVAQVHLCGRQKFGWSITTHTYGEEVLGRFLQVQTAIQDAVPSFLLSDSERSSFLGQKWRRPTWLSGGHLGSSFVQNYHHISASPSPRLESYPSVPCPPTVEWLWGQVTASCRRQCSCNTADVYVRNHLHRNKLT